MDCVPIETKVKDQKKLNRWGDHNYNHNVIKKAYNKLKGVYMEHQAIRKFANNNIPLEYLIEKHHSSYGRPWILGKFVFNFLLENGLSKTDKIMDFGCGAGRLGIHLIKHLNPAGYFGIDAHWKSLDAYSRYEIPLHNLEDKEPRLFWDFNFDFHHFKTTFDKIVEVNVTNHLQPEEKQIAFTKAAEVLKTGGLYFITPFPKDDDSYFEQFGFEVIKKTKQHIPEFEGHDFEDYNAWLVLRKR